MQGPPAPPPPSVPSPRRASPASASAAALLSTARDEVREVEGERHHLEIVSLLPRPQWGSRTGIRYRGSWYLLQRQDTVGAPGQQRHRFFLARAPEGIAFRDFWEYDPEEVRRLWWEKLRFEKATWVETFAPLWGFLDPSFQRAFEETYGYDASHYTLWSVAGTAVLTALIGTLAFSRLAAGRGGALDLLLLPAGAYLFAESIARWRALREGRIEGSVLGWLLGPLAARLTLPPRP